MFGYRLQRNIYWKRLVLLSIVILLTLLVPVILPLMSLLGINLPSIPWYVIGPATITCVAAELMVTFRVLGIHFWKDYPDECVVYYLHHLTREKLWHHLVTYPWIDYIPNPLIAHIEKIIQKKPLDQLYGQGFLITGLPGAGKSLTIIRLVECLRDRIGHEQSPLRRFPSPYHPKVVVVTQPVLLVEKGIQLPRFSEPTIVIVDDLQRLSGDQIKKLTDFLRPYLGERTIVLCAIRSPATDSLTQTLRNFQHIECSVHFPDAKRYEAFLIAIIGAAAKKFHIQAGSQIRKRLVTRVVKGHQPLLYIVALFKYLQDKGLRRLTKERLDEVPPELEAIYKQYWSEVKPHHTDLLRAFK